MNAVAETVRKPIRDYAAAVAEYGEVLGVPVSPDRIDHVLDVIADTATDVFGSKIAAKKFLAESPIDNGKLARVVVAEIGISRVLSRIDGLRFGVFG